MDDYFFIRSFGAGGNDYILYSVWDYLLFKNHWIVPDQTRYYNEWPVAQALRQFIETQVLYVSSMTPHALHGYCSPSCSKGLIYDFDWEIMEYFCIIIEK